VREPAPIWPDAPRYGPAEPWPAYRFTGAPQPHPTRDPKGHSWGREAPAVHVPAARWREDAAWLRGVDLYHQGYLWEAHETWEGIWKASSDPFQRSFLQGLIQLAAALLKHAAGRADGARRLAAAAREQLARVAAVEPVYMGLALPPVLAALDPLHAPRLALTP